MTSADARPVPEQGPYGCAVTAHLLALDEVGRWLILRTTSDHSRWQLPGGRVRRGESPAAAATREAREETGLLGMQTRRLITVAWIPASSPARHDRLAFVFATRTLLPEDLAALTLQTEEVDDWLLLPAQHASTWLHPLVAERLTEAGRHGPGHYIDQDPASRRERTLMP
ncbi:NUDIX domain-containing protein [Streptosporangium sp. NPDC000509]|uniref:NUDIX domain-containing protein n=1 Tax=Streptosporangium sp. NPDC000509 TaxID=3366186 RepID=UPI0036BE6F7F